jgi:hypothetical protein
MSGPSRKHGTDGSMMPGWVGGAGALPVRRSALAGSASPPGPRMGVGPCRGSLRGTRTCHGRRYRCCRPAAAYGEGHDADLSCHIFQDHLRRAFSHSLRSGSSCAQPGARTPRGRASPDATTPCRRLAALCRHAERRAAGRGRCVRLDEVAAPLIAGGAHPGNLVHPTEARSTMPNASSVVELRKPTNALTKDGAVCDGPGLEFMGCLVVEEATGAGRKGS